MVEQHQTGEITGFAVWLPARRPSRSVIRVIIYAEQICKEPHVSSYWFQCQSHTMPCHVRKRRGRSKSAAEKGLGNAALINSAAVCHLLQWEIYAVINLSVVARTTKGTQHKFVDTVLWKLQNGAEALMWQSWILFWLGILLENAFLSFN